VHIDCADEEMTSDSGAAFKGAVFASEVPRQCGRQGIWVHSGGARLPQWMLPADAWLGSMSSKKGRQAT